MSNLQDKIAALVRLGQLMLSEDEAWLGAKQLAVQRNQWFTREHIDLAVKNIVNGLLQQEALEDWAAVYPQAAAIKTIGIVMAGNIPLVGFHDFLCVYISGHQARIKYSSKDEVLLPFLLQRLAEWDPAVQQQVTKAEILKGCDAYIATGSNNSARYFEQYFGRFPHIIRHNRTSVAVLDGAESPEELEALADDIFMYFGLGCRNVTQLCVPGGYDFDPLLKALKKYDFMMGHNKYHNNYDYYLAIYLLNRVPYLNNDLVLLVENIIPFTAVAVLHYRYYTDKQELMQEMEQSEDIQCVVGKEALPFGSTQQPGLRDYPDGADVMAFLSGL